MREIAFLIAILFFTISIFMRLVEFVDEVERLHYSGKPDRRRRIVSAFIEIAIDLSAYFIVIFIIHRFK